MSSANVGLALGNRSKKLRRFLTWEMASKWEWDVVGVPVMKPAKKASMDGSCVEHEYVQLACPLGCGCTVEVILKNRSKHQSVLGRAHLRKCPMLSEQQRSVFAKTLESTKAKPKAKRKSLPAPPQLQEGMSTEDYIKSFASQPKQRR